MKSIEPSSYVVMLSKKRKNLKKHRIFANFFKKPLDKGSFLVYNLIEPNGSERKRRAK